MDHNPDRIVLWPGYFDAKKPRRAGRRVPKDAAVKNPDLEGLILAARTAGVKKMKREERISHPKRPHALEGRLWLSRKGAKGIHWYIFQRRDYANYWRRLAKNA